jgi:multiple sugar transport system permease protein
MMQRLVQFVLLTVSLGVLAVVSAMIAGLLPATPGQTIWATGVVLAFALSVAFGAARPARVTLYTSLTAGAVVFTLPFLWLISTSMKQPEETFVFPPRWLPAVADAPLLSPWVASDGKERRFELGTARLRFADGREAQVELSWSADGATLFPSDEGLLVRYDFASRERFSLRADLSGDSSGGTSVESVTLRIRGDESWNRLRATLQVGGKRFELGERLFLGARSWLEWTFTLAESDPEDRALGIWPMRPSGGASGRDEMVLVVERRGVVGATLARWTQSYRDAWYADANWSRYILNSVLLVVLNIIGQLLACSMAAFALARLDWPGRETLFGLILATMMLPGVVVLIPQFLVFKTLGWYGTLLPLWVPAFAGSAFFIFMLRQFMMQLPRDLEEAARIDGCSWFGIYWRIILPLMRPALAAVAIFTFMGTWNEFMGPLIYLGDERQFPLSLGLYGFRSEHSRDFNMLMAASTMMTLPAIALFFLAQRYFIEGVTLTGMKG